jgi:hypothetical protein
VRARLAQQQVNDGGTGGGVKVARGFIGQHQRGRVHQRTGNGHPLQLPAREGARHALAQPLQAHLRQHLLHPRWVGARGQQQRQRHVLGHSQVRQHMECLEHKAQLRAPPAGTGGFVQCGDVGAAHHHLSAFQWLQPRQRIEQGGLAHARLAQHRHHLARGHRQVHPGKQGRTRKRLGQLVGVQHGC